jgi:hypothetical protein
MGILTFNSCLHGLQKLFASTWIGPKICDNLKIKFKYLKIGEMFL